MLRNLKEAFQQENIGVLLFFAVVLFFFFLMELLILSCTAFLACHIVNHLPDECVDTVSIKTLGECFDRVYFRAATEASRLP